LCLPKDSQSYPEKEGGENMEQQGDSDVIIVLLNIAGDSIRGKIIPYWECDFSRQELIKRATTEATDFSEELGYGPTTFEIKDYRAV